MKFEKKYTHGYGIVDIVKYVCRRPTSNIDYNSCVNKYLVKEVVRNTINFAKPFCYIRNMSEFGRIDFNQLPKKYIVKAVHGAGMNYVVDNNNEVDINKIRDLCALWLQRDFHHESELHYRHVENGVLFEEFLGENLVNYKFYVINHVVEFIFIHRYSPQKIWEMVSRDWKHLYEAYNYPWYVKYLNQITKHPPDMIEHGWIFRPNAFKKPPNLQELISTVGKLSNLVGDVPYVRIDIYNIDDVPYFGEYTFTPEAGIDNGYYNPAFSKYVGSLIDFKVDPKDMKLVVEEWKKEFIHRRRVKEKMKHMKKVEKNK